MENFDFDKVLEYMQWDKSHREYDDEGRCIGKSPYLSIATGPFKVICRYGMLELIACLETWSYD